MDFQPKGMMSQHQTSLGYQFPKVVTKVGSRGCRDVSRTNLERGFDNVSTYIEGWRNHGVANLYRYVDTERIVYVSALSPCLPTEYRGLHIE